VAAAGLNPRTRSMIPHKVLILGGYGNFGRRIARALVTADIPVIIAGRDAEKAAAVAHELGALAESAGFDANQELTSHLPTLAPLLLINTCGPFQTADHRIARACIESGVHYIELADGRDFVTGMTALDAQAKEKNVVVLSGASTVPGLSSAVLEHFKPEFGSIDSLIYGISPGQRTARGLATTQGILTYVGRQLKPFAGTVDAYGWQDIHRQDYPALGKRLMANCDIPDLDLLPPRYGIRFIRFSAGLEFAPLHLGLWLLSWLVRSALPLNLPAHAKLLLKLSTPFDRFGSADGGMHMIIRGRAADGSAHMRRWFIIAKDGCGPHIPTIPAIILAKKLVAGGAVERGAYPCVGVVGLDEYLAELRAYPIYTVTEPVSAREGLL